MIYSYTNEQGFNITAHGEPSRVVENMEGLLLMRQSK